MSETKGKQMENEDNTSEQKTLVGSSQEKSSTCAHQGTISTNTQPSPVTQKKSIIKQRMDIALFMASASQLNSLVSMKDDVHNFDFLFALSILSMSLQVLAGVSSICEWKIGKIIDKHKDNEKYRDEEKNWKSDKRLRKRKSRFDMVGVFLVLLIIVVNVILAAFGISTRNNNN